MELYSTTYHSRTLSSNRGYRILVLFLSVLVLTDTAEALPERDELINEARMCEKKRNYSEAIRLYEESLRVNSASAGDLDVKYRLAELYNNLGRSTPDYETVIKILNNIIQDYPHEQYLVIMSHIKLAELYFRRGRENDQEIARGHYDAVLSIEPRLKSNPEAFPESELDRTRRAVGYVKRRVERRPLWKKRRTRSFRKLLDTTIESAIALPDHGLVYRKQKLRTSSHSAVTKPQPKTPLHAEGAKAALAISTPSAQVTNGISDHNYRAAWMSALTLILGIAIIGTLFIIRCYYKKERG